MACRLHVTWDERLADYHFGPGHPLAPVRVELTMRLAHEFGLWARPGVTVAAPTRATDAELALVHDPGYIAAVRTITGWAEDLGARGLEETHLRYARAFGLGTEDNPVFPGMHQASALVTGATLAAARAVWSGTAQHGAAIAGGMHHAMAAHASGFGVYNDVAVAIAWLLGRGAERILAEAAGQPINPAAQTPDRWRDYVARRTGLTAPEHMTEGTPAVFEPFESGCNPSDPVDRAIMATRNAVFPLHGLMPL